MKTSTTEKLDPEVYVRFYENAEDMLFLLDPSGRFININPKFAQMLGYGHEELVGRSSKHIIHPEDFDSLKNFFKSVLSGNREKGEFRFINREGNVVWIEISEWPVYDDGKLVRIEGIARNVTERKKLEESLKKRNEILELLFKILRHDIANNMTSALNYLELYVEIEDKSFLSGIKRSLERTVSLIKEVEEVEKSIHADMREKYGLKTIVKKIASNYPVKVKFKGDCSIVADEAIYTVFDNLIRNAVTHGKASKIEVEVEEKDDCYLIMFADNGTGISEDIADRIFDEGFSSGGGKGLGLYIVRRVIERYGGEIKLDRTKKDGARFLIKLRK